jgi:hypothetical protein
MKRTSLRDNFLSRSFRNWWHAYLAAASALLFIGVWVLVPVGPSPDWTFGDFGPGPSPRATLTPGAVIRASASEVCTPEFEGRVHVVPASLKHKVFQEYRIPNAHLRNYEIDYLITPELGGSDEIENLWPQPYTAPVWNAYVKDALEERLHQLVCDKRLDLATAQHEMSSDWITAYKKYFRTDRPIASHSGFTAQRENLPGIRSMLRGFAR